MKIRAQALVIFLMLTGITLPVSAETDVFPILAYSDLILDGQTVHSFGGAAVVQKGESSLAVSYLNSQFLRQAEQDVPSAFHTVDFLLDVKKSRQQYLLIVKGSSDKPFAGGLGTYQAGAAWGYKIVNEDSVSLILGAGAAVGEFGIDSPLIPVPLLRLSGKWEYAQFSFDFLTGPNLSATLFPGSKIRISLDSRMDKFRDIGDLLFDCPALPFF